MRSESGMGNVPGSWVSCTAFWCELALLVTRNVGFSLHIFSLHWFWHQLFFLAKAKKYKPVSCLKMGIDGMDGSFSDLSKWKDTALFRLKGKLTWNRQHVGWWITICLHPPTRTYLAIHSESFWKTDRDLDWTPMWKGSFTWAFQSGPTVSFLSGPDWKVHGGLWLCPFTLADLSRSG